jgi:O-antigen/teichoic acid export membrane protein
MVTAALMSLVLLLFAGPIVRLLGGAQYRGAVPVLRILALLPLALTAATLLAQVVMINLGLARSLSRIYVAMGILNLAMLPLLASWLGARGGAISLLCVETLGPVLMVGAIRRTGHLQVNPA